MIINQIGARFEYEGIIYVIGAPIVGTAESEYEGLYGRITEIRDGKDKETENGAPEIYCSFDAPVLPCEVKELEKRFSELYREPKAIGDIGLGLVIMAPGMVCPLEDLKECRSHPMVYVLMEDWAIDGEHGNSSDICTDFNDARRLLVQKLGEEMEKGCIPNWSCRGDFVAGSTPCSYECYLDGGYCENHYSVSIVAKKLCASERYVRETARLYTASCQLRDFTTEVSGWDEIGQLTDGQYERMVHDPEFPERFQKALGRNDYYWEAYWETLAETAHEFVDGYIKESQSLDTDGQPAGLVSAAICTVCTADPARNFPKAGNNQHPLV